MRSQLHVHTCGLEAGILEDAGATAKSFRGTFSGWRSTSWDRVRVSYCGTARLPGAGCHAAPNDRRFEQLEAVRLHDLQGENPLFGTNYYAGDFLLNCGRKQGLELRIVRRSPRDDWVQTLVVSGLSGRARSKPKGATG